MPHNNQTWAIFLIFTLHFRCIWSVEILCVPCVEKASFLQLNSRDTPLYTQEKGIIHVPTVTSDSKQRVIYHNISTRTNQRRFISARNVENILTLDRTLGFMWINVQDLQNTRRLHYRANTGLFFPSDIDIQAKINIGWHWHSTSPLLQNCGLSLLHHCTSTLSVK